MSEQSQYRNIAKNTAVIGGAQIVQMLVNIVKAKVVAILLGPMGMGVNSLILSAISIIQQFSSMGIFQSGIRDLSHTYNSGDAIKFANMRKIFNRLTLVSGIIGVFVCIVLAPFLSDFSFGNRDYTWSFVAVSVTLLFMSLQSGKTTILQATQNLRLIAKATIVGAVINLTLTIPMFYFWGINGIVPAIVVGYVVFYLVNKYYESKIIFAAVDTPSKAQMIAHAKPMLKLGFVLMISNLLMVIFTFLLNGFISHLGSVSDVGLFQAAFAICMQSMIIINSTLASDYFPRLVAIHSDKHLLSETVNRQAEIMLYIIAPISILLIAFAPVIVSLLLSSDFAPIIPLLQTMSLALCFRVIWIILAYIMLSKGDKKNYLIYDVIIGNGFNFILNIFAYYFWGLEGLGISYIVGSIFMILILSFITYKRYKVLLGKTFMMSFFAIFTLIIITYLTSTFLDGFTYYLLLSLSVLIVIAWSFHGLNKKLEIRTLIKNKFSK